MLRRFGIAAVLILVGAVLVFFGMRKHAQGANSAKDGDDAGANSSASPLSTTIEVAAKKGSIAGHIKDAQGNFLGNAMVCATASSPKLVSADTKEPRCERTNKQGEYVIHELFPARYTVDATAITFQPARTREHFTLSAGEDRTGVDLVLEHGGVEVHGEVKDISGGVVIGAAVKIIAGKTWSPTASVFTTSDARGEFSAWLMAGPVAATASANGYNSATKEGIAPGQRLEILLTPESVLQGRVVEAGTDNPVAGARVLSGMVRANQFTGGPDASTLTDADGRFRIAGLEPGRYQPTATSDHHFGTTSESVLLGLAETSRDMVIELRSSASLIGRIELENKQPCPDGSVSLKAKGTQENHYHRADTDGRLRIEGLEPGTYAVEVYCSNAASADTYPPVKIGKDNVTVTWPVSTGASVAGIVVDDQGAPIASAQVQAQTLGGAARAKQDWSSGTTGPDGTFEIRGLLHAKYGFTVDREGAVPLADPFEVEVNGDVKGVRIQLPAGGGLDGTVVDDKGAPVAGLDVDARGDRWEWGKGRTISRDDGTFALPALRPGTYHVQAQYRWTAARAPGTKDDDQQGTLATVKVGATAHVKLVVESQNSHIDGTVLDDSGTAISDAFVEAERESDSAGAAEGSARRSMQWSWGSTIREPVLTDVDGHFTIGKLSPGSYTVRAFRKGGGEAVSEGVKVGTSVTITIKKEGSIAGTVTSSSGPPPDQFAIALHDDKTGVSRRETFSHTNGAWVVRDLPVGNFVVAAEATGRAQTTVALAQGENKTGIQLSLAPNGSARGRIISLETNEPVMGMMVFAKPKGGEGQMVMNSGDGERKNVSDADGRFELDEAPPGRLTLMIIPKDMNAEGAYAFAMLPATLNPGAVVELPPIRVVKSRSRGGIEGDFGFVTQSPPPDADLAEVKIIVSSVRPGSSAAKAGVVVGDELVSVDGYDVTAPNTYLMWGLLNVAPGATVKVGFRRGATVSLTAESPAAK